MEEEALVYSRMLKRKLEENSYSEILNIMKRFKRREFGPECVASKVEALFHGQTDLIVGFRRFLPRKHAKILNGDDDSTIAVDHGRVCTNVVCKKMKQFDTCSPLMVPRIVARVDLKQSDGGHGEFDTGFKVFSGKNYEDGGVIINGNTQVENGHRVCEKPSEGSVAAMKSAVEFINLVQKSFNGDHMCKKFLDAMATYRRLKDVDRLEQEISDLFKSSPELYVEFTTFMADAIAKQSTSEEVDHGVFRSRKSRFKKINVRSLSQKIMNRYEDDMYEQDMLLHRLESTIEAMDRLREACENNPNETINMEDYVSVINLGCIKRLYRECGDEMVDRLRENPRDASRVIVSRLRPKFEELKQGSSQVNKQRAAAIKKLHGR